MKELELNVGDLIKFRVGKEPYGNPCLVSEKETLNEPFHYTCILIDIINNEKHILNKTHRWYKEDRQRVSLRIKKLTKV